MNNFIKTSALTLSLAFSGMAFANGPVAAPAAPAAPAAKVEKVEKAVNAKVATHKEKLKEAREECIKGDANLKGKELHKCVKSHMGK